MYTVVGALGGVLLVSLAGQAAAYTLARARNRTPSLLIGLTALAAGAMGGEAMLHAIPEAAEAWEGRDLRIFGILLATGFGVTMLAGTLLRQRMNRPHLAGTEPVAWTTQMGDAVCNFADGIAIAASFTISVPLGVAATIAILLHEVPQEIGQCAVCLRAGMAPNRVIAWNAFTAVPAFLGAGIILLVPWSGGSLERIVLPLVAGAFLHIAAADLLPELRRATAGVSALRIGGGFSAGLVLMLLLLGIEA